MRQETVLSAWIRAIGLWHAVAFFLTGIACFGFPWAVFGEVAFIPMASLPARLFGAALTTIGIFLIIATISRSVKVMRIALITAFILDMQVSVILLAFTLQIDNAELMGNVPAAINPLIAFLAFAIPSAVAVFKLRDEQPATG